MFNMFNIFVSESKSLKVQTILEIPFTSLLHENFAYWYFEYATLLFSVHFYFILLKMGIKLNACIILNLWKDRICCTDFLPSYANFMHLELFMFHLRRKGDFLVYFAEYHTTVIQFPMYVAINRIKSTVKTCTKHEILYLFIQREVWQK